MFRLGRQVASDLLEIKLLRLRQFPWGEAFWRTCAVGYEGESIAEVAQSRGWSARRIEQLIADIRRAQNGHFAPGGQFR